METSTSVLCLNWQLFCSNWTFWSKSSLRTEMAAEKWHHLVWILPCAWHCAAKIRKRLPSPGTGGTTGVTVGTLHCQRQRAPQMAKKVMRETEILRFYKSERTGIHSMESYHQDLRWFKTSILSTRSVTNKICLPLNTTGCFAAVA